MRQRMGNRSLRVIIIGGGFTNKGAEAMALTTVEQIIHRFPDAHVVIASYTQSEDVEYGVQRNARGIRGTFRYIRNSRGWTKPVGTLALGLPVPNALRAWVTRLDPYIAELAEADLVLDVSGFAMSDQRELLRQLMYCFEIASCRWLGIPFVAMTQAFGPFSGIQKFLARHFLPKADLLIARGASTGAHLEGAGITEFRTCPDMAYLFPSGDPAEGRRLLTDAGLAPSTKGFGIVPNINLYRRSGGTDEDNAYIRGMARVAALATELGAVPVFLCHEGYEDRRSDAWVAQQIIRAAGLERSVIISARHTAAELKAMLQSLDFVVACRFHAVVAAISTATPFLALGWAHKYEELVREAGEPNAVMDGRYTNGEQWRARVRELWLGRDAMRERMQQRVGPLKAAAAEAFDAVEQIVVTRRQVARNRGLDAMKLAKNGRRPDAPAATGNGSTRHGANGSLLGR